MEYLAAIITAIGTIVTTVLSIDMKSTQKSREKVTDLKIEAFKSEQEAKYKRRNDSSSIVFGELWNVLYLLKADRVYIVQPHPLGNECMLSVYYEVKRKGVEGMREKIHSLKMAEVARFSADMSKNLFMYISNIDEQVDDRYAKALLLCKPLKKFLYAVQASLIACLVTLFEILSNHAYSSECLSFVNSFLSSASERNFPPFS